jgi:hypothetical protein
MRPLLDDIYEALDGFHHFNGDCNDVAFCYSTIINGERFVVFDSLGVLGFFSDRVNPKFAPVRVWSDSVARIVFADTTGRHMLVGQRRWKVKLQNQLGVFVGTESYDQPRGILNRIGMSWMGVAKQLRVWNAYLLNIRKFYEKVYPVRMVRSSTVVAKHQYLPGQKNPWGCQSPYPGMRVATGGPY